MSDMAKAVTLVPRLTQTERHVLALYIVHGSYKAVARARGRSERTTKYFGSSALRKLGVDSIAQACVALDRFRRLAAERSDGPGPMSR